MVGVPARGVRVAPEGGPGPTLPSFRLQICPHVPFTARTPSPSLTPSLSHVLGIYFRSSFAHAACLLREAKPGAWESSPSAHLRQQPGSPGWGSVPRPSKISPSSLPRPADLLPACWWFCFLPPQKQGCENVHPTRQDRPPPLEEALKSGDGEAGLNFSLPPKPSLHKHALCTVCENLKYIYPLTTIPLLEISLKGFLPAKCTKKYVQGSSLPWTLWI